MIYNSGSTGTGTFLFTGVIEKSGEFYMDQPPGSKKFAADTYMVFATPVVYFTDN